MDLIVNGINIMVIVFGLVEFAKKLGLDGKGLTVLSMVLGVLAGIVYQLVQMYPEAAPWVQVVVFGLAVGLAASGIYDFANARWPKVKG